MERLFKNGSYLHITVGLGRYILDNTVLVILWKFMHTV